MKILKVVPKYPPPVVGGLEHQAALQAGALAKAGHSVTVLSDRPHGPPKTRELDQGLEILRYGGVSRSLPNRAWTTLCYLRFILFRGRAYDVCHIHNLSMVGGLCAMLCRWVGLPAFVKVPNVGERGIAGFANYGPSAPFRCWLLRQSTGLIALTSETHAEAADAGIEEERVHLIMNGIATEAFKTREHPGDDAAAAEVTFIFVGRMFPHKGIPELTEVWAELKAFYPAVRLLLVGEGPEQERLQRDADFLERMNIELLGHRSDIPDLLSKADVFVLPSHEEGNSNAVLEAMASGLPILSTRVGGTAQLVGEAGAPFIIEKGDRRALLDRLKQLASGARLRRELGERMRARCEERFSIHAVAGRLEALYSKATRIPR